MNKNLKSPCLSTLTSSDHQKCTQKSHLSTTYNRVKPLVAVLTSPPLPLRGGERMSTREA